jgi:hypothetical protein
MTSDLQPELKECPWCDHIGAEFILGEDDLAWMMCEKCHTPGPAVGMELETDEEIECRALIAYNTRPSSPALAHRLRVEGAEAALDHCIANDPQGMWPQSRRSGLAESIVTALEKREGEL